LGAAVAWVYRWRPYGAAINFPTVVTTPGGQTTRGRGETLATMPAVGGVGRSSLRDGVRDLEDVPERVSHQRLSIAVRRVERLLEEVDLCRNVIDDDPRRD
jgi:hypothetical protein